jgi:hypothetical protein
MSFAGAKRTQPRAAALAREHRTLMRKRARRIRRSVAGLTAALFCTAFLVIYVQLASGHDPALLANAKRAASTSAGSASTSASGTAGGESSTSSSSSSSEQTSTGATAVRTAQS